MKFKPFAYFLVLLVTLFGCYPDESLDVPLKEVPDSTDPIDIYIDNNFIETYGIAVRYKFVDRYVDPSKRVTPPEREVIIPMLDFLTSFWIEPFINVPNGKKFFESHVPSEMVFIGSSIFNGDGTVTLGTADAGARITLTEVNQVDTTDLDWILRQLGTIYHEFAHIVHQRYDLPPNFQEIASNGYTSSGSWYNLTDEEALKRGFVSPYGTSSANEDFAEFVAFLLFDKNFYETYINDEANCGTADCEERNEGRARLRLKYTSILKHYQTHTGVDLLNVRALVQEKLYP
jgi:substrate import-associated zinc metallohydrolase lipoprotein